MTHEAEIGIPIESLELSIRAMNALTSSGIRTLEQIEARSNDQLRRIPKLGEKSIKEIRDAIRFIRKGTPSPNDMVVAWAIAHSNLVLALISGEAVIIPQNANTEKN